MVIPVFNCERFVGDAVRSVLEQTYPSVECIVVDDGSTDRTNEVLATFKDQITMVEQPNQGVARARNAGIQRASGSHVAFLDADDVWLRTKLEKQVEIMKRRPELALTYTGIRIVGEDLTPLRDMPAVSPSQAFENMLMMREAVMSVAQTGLFRRDVLLHLQGFDERMSTSADTDLACRTAIDYETESLSECLALYRIHQGQMHENVDATERDMDLMFKKLFAERRELAGGFERRARAALSTTLAFARWQNGERKRAFGDFLRAIGKQPVVPALALVSRIVKRSPKEQSPTR